MTNLPIWPRSLNTMRPVILAKSVSSFPRPTLSPGFTRVPRWRTMMVPPGTTCPPNALKPSRCALESRPFRDVPCPFLCAIESVLSSRLAAARLYCPIVELLLFCWRLLRRFLGGFLFGGLRGCGFRFPRRGSLLGLGLFLWELRGFKGLTVVGDFGD